MDVVWFRTSRRDGVMKSRDRRCYEVGTIRDPLRPLLAASDLREARQCPFVGRALRGETGKPNLEERPRLLELANPAVLGEQQPGGSRELLDERIVAGRAVTPARSPLLTLTRPIF